MDNKRLAIIAGVSILLLILMFLPFSMHKGGNSISMATKYITKNISKTGKFVFRNYPKASVQNNINSYYEIRHADVLYSMYLAEKNTNDKKLRQKRILASKFMFNNNIQHYKGDMWISATPNLSNSAKLGSAGLTLAAVSNLYREDSSYLEKLNGLAKFIVYMQKPDGSFYHKVNLENNQIDKNSYFVYYPSMAALGLLCLNEVAPNQLWITASKKALLNLVMTGHNNRPDVTFDSWAIIAIRKLFESTNNTLTQEEHDILRNYIEQTTKFILKKQITVKSDPLYGSIKGDTKLGSNALIFEGIASAYYCTDNPKLQARIKTALHAGTKFLSKYQIKSGKYKGGIPSDVNWKKSNDTQLTQIRMDNVGHALSVWVMYKNLK